MKTLKMNSLTYLLISCFGFIATIYWQQETSMLVFISTFFFPTFVIHLFLKSNAIKQSMTLKGSGVVFVVIGLLSLICNHIALSFSMFLVVSVLFVSLIQDFSKIYTLMILIVLIPLSARLNMTFHHLNLFSWSGDGHHIYFWPLLPWVGIFAIYKDHFLASRNIRIVYLLLALSTLACFRQSLWEIIKEPYLVSMGLSPTYDQLDRVVIIFAIYYVILFVIDTLGSKVETT